MDLLKKEIILPRLKTLRLLVMRADQMDSIKGISTRDIKEDVAALEETIFKEEVEGITNLVMMTQTDFPH